MFGWWAYHTSWGHIGYIWPSRFFFSLQRDVVSQPRWGPLTWSTASCCFAQQSLTATWLLAAVFVLRLPRVSVAWWCKCLQSLCSQLPLWKLVFSRPVVLLLLQCLHIPLVSAHMSHPQLPLIVVSSTMIRHFWGFDHRIVADQKVVIICGPGHVGFSSPQSRTAGHLLQLDLLGIGLDGTTRCLIFSWLPQLLQAAAGPIVVVLQGVEAFNQLLLQPVRMYKPKPFLM